MMSNHKGSSFGAFLAGIFTAVAVGGYFLFGSKNARRNRAKVDLWVEDAKQEVLAKVRRMRDLTEEKFNETVDTVAEKYSRLKNLSAEKTDELRDELKRRWREAQEKADEET